MPVPSRNADGVTQHGNSEAISVGAIQSLSNFSSKLL
jgi:hypothetical protein